MYRLGCCIPGASFMPQTGGEKAYAYDALTRGCRCILETGFDFAEATVGTLFELSEDELLRARSEGMRIEVCNSFVPPSLPFASTPSKELYAYVAEAMRRMRTLGAQCVVLGSGQARRIPEQTPDGERFSKLAGFLRICSELYGEYGVTTVLEPLNFRETNCINKVSEGAALVNELSLPGIFLLADAYHMSVEGEPLSMLGENEDILKHIHISEPDRKAPGLGEGTYLKAFSDTLKTTRYSGRVSVECVFSAFETECAASYIKAKELFKITTKNA